MADNDTTKAPAAPPRVETGIATDSSLSAEFQTGGGDPTITRSDDGGGASVDFDARGQVDKEDALTEGDAGDKQDGEGAEGDGSEGTEGTGEQSEGPEDLGEFKADDLDTVAKFEKRYFTEDGHLNRGALSEEFWANYGKAQAEGKEGGLNEGTYAYLEHQLGIDRETAKDIEQGLVAKQQAQLNGFYESVGGQDRYNAALTWASGGDDPTKAAYTKEQQTRFNELLQKGGPDFQDAVEALMARYSKATGDAGRQPPRDQRRGAPRRPSSPARSATGGADTAPADERMTEGQYAAELQAARTAQRNAATPEDKRKADKAYFDLRSRARASGLRRQ